MKIGMLFSDYGSQYVGMGKELYDNSRLMQEYFEEAFNCLNINFVKLCFASSDAELAKIENAYVSIFLVSVAIAEIVKQENIIPVEVAGYGIGEISAITVAHGLSLPDGLYFLHKYAQFYQDFLQQHDEYAMVRVKGLSNTKIQKQVQEHEVNVAIYESENQQIVSGNKTGLRAFEHILTSAGISVQDVDRNQGLHSEVMMPVVEQLTKYLEKIDFKDLAIPWYASADASLQTKKELVKKRLLKQLHAPIYWNKVLNHCADWDVIIEIGPLSKTSYLLHEKYPDKKIFSVQKGTDIEALKEYLSVHNNN